MRWLYFEKRDLVTMKYLNWRENSDDFSVHRQFYFFSILSVFAVITMFRLLLSERSTCVFAEYQILRTAVYLR